jgi:hypothetical protein
MGGQVTNTGTVQRSPAELYASIGIGATVGGGAIGGTLAEWSVCTARASHTGGMTEGAFGLAMLAMAGLTFGAIGGTLAADQVMRRHTLRSAGVAAAFGGFAMVGIPSAWKLYRSHAVSDAAEHVTSTVRRVDCKPVMIAGAALMAVGIGTALLAPHHDGPAQS